MTLLELQNARVQRIVDNWNQQLTGQVSQGELFGSIVYYEDPTTDECERARDHFRSIGLETEVQTKSRWDKFWDGNSLTIKFYRKPEPR